MATDTRMIKFGVWIFVLVLMIIIFVAAGGSTIFGLDKFSPAVEQYVFFGSSWASIKLEVAPASGQFAPLIVSLMVWLIIFAAFGDILENWSAFSEGIGWIVAFAIAVVAANVGIIQGGVVVLIGWFAWAGTAAIFIALLFSIFAFAAVNMGITSLSTWVKNRQVMLRSATGRTYATAGLETLETVGKKSTEPAHT
jgi:hypothetical protein